MKNFGNKKAIGALVLLALSMSGCFQTHTYRKGTAGGVVNNGSGSDSGIPAGNGDGTNPNNSTNPNNPLGAVDGVTLANDRTALGYETLTVAGAQYLKAGNEFFALPAQIVATGTTIPTAPVREITGSGCLFKVRSLDGTVLTQSPFPSIVATPAFESDIIATLQTTESTSFSEVSAINAGYQKMIGFSQSLWTGAGAYVNPVFGAKVYYGAGYRAVPFNSAPFNIPDYSANPINNLGNTAGSFIVEVQGTDNTACGFDFTHPDFKPIREQNFAAVRERMRHVGPWMMDDTGVLKQPACTSDGGVCQQGFAQRVAGSNGIPPTPHFFSIIRGSGAKRNWFTVSVPSLGLDYIKLRFWGFSASASLIGWEPNNTQQIDPSLPTRCSRAGTWSDSYTGKPDVGYPLGKLIKQMCIYENWFYDTQR